MIPRLTVLCMGLLAACATAPDPRLGAGRVEQAGIAFDEAFRDTPFADGAAIRIVATDPDPVRNLLSYVLVPCRDGTAICGGDANGPAGTIVNVEGRTRITGAYPGVDFYLDSRGSGYLTRNGVNVPLAWD
ncbi:hypothetical protein EU805_12870 [Salipiger sp. IMCC34102]|uniref:hypothetical protein n=1 Tax=Salipiger sp. IMCC34102 TaxID=2510647 RepID=UPI00101D7FF0|nr:hypothetical protein [Salipiger sp. IMCC34102]RYH01551.1 hypothetical protein EU805_12870 [Salipiger sp. IMCC34102]